MLGVIRSHGYVTAAIESGTRPRGGEAAIMGDESQKIDALFIDLDADAWRLLWQRR